MATLPESSKQQILDRMAHSRAEIRHVLEPAPRSSQDAEAAGILDDTQEGGFPRSRTMQLLMSGRGLGTIGAVVGGFIMARPALAFKLLRILPTGAVAKMLLAKAVTVVKNR